MDNIFLKLFIILFIIILLPNTWSYNKSSLSLLLNNGWGYIKNKYIVMQTNLNKKIKQRLHYLQAKQRYKYLSVINTIEDDIYQYARFAQVTGGLSIILSIYAILSSSYIGVFFSIGCMAAAIASLFRICKKTKEIKSITDLMKSYK